MIDIKKRRNFKIFFLTAISILFYSYNNKYLDFKMQAKGSNWLLDVNDN